jgi:ABC-2 type transport system ATP-binding protein
MAAIEVENLKIFYGTRSAVDDVSFVADKKEVVALLGPNGAGKTSTVETLEGYRVPGAGKVRVLGLDPHAEHSRVVAEIGVVLQNGGVYPVMTPRRVLALFSSYYPKPRQPEELLELLGLKEVATTPFKRLSGGEKQRLLLALALVGRPSVCFLDEPTAGVDPAGRVVVRQVIDQVRQEGAAVLLTSHELDEVERMADRVVIMNEGRLVASGSPAELAGPEEIRFSTTSLLDTTALAQFLGLPVTTPSPGQYQVATNGDPAVVARLTTYLSERGVGITDLRVGRERLEDVFLRLVRQQQP